MKVRENENENERGERERGSLQYIELVGLSLVSYLFVSFDVDVRFLETWTLPSFQ
jgi:hypothetical protein